MLFGCCMCVHGMIAPVPLGLDELVTGSLSCLMRLIDTMYRLFLEHSPFPGAFSYLRAEFPPTIPVLTAIAPISLC